MHATLPERLSAQFVCKRFEKPIDKKPCGALHELLVMLDSGETAGWLDTLRANGKKKGRRLLPLCRPMLQRFATDHDGRAAR